MNVEKALTFSRLALLWLVKNNFYMEKNPTIVTFPVKNLELRDYLHVATELGLPRCHARAQL
jgi:hypothetical protein